MKPRRSTVEVELNPYSDGSGYAHTVVVKRDNEDFKLEIKQHDHWITMSDDEWFTIRDALDAAIHLVGGPDCGGGELPEQAKASIHNET